VTEDDRLLLAYLAGAFTVAVVVPTLAWAAVRYVPPVRRAAREAIANTLDQKIADVRAGLEPTLRAVDASVTGIVQASTREPIAVTIHNRITVPVADAALNAVVGA